MVELRRDLAFRGTNHIKTAFVDVLRGIFASSIIDERYRYVPENW